MLRELCRLVSSRARIASVNKRSNSGRCVQRVFPRVAHLSRTCRAFGANAIDNRVLWSQMTAVVWFIFLPSGEESYIAPVGRQPSRAVQSDRRAVRPVHFDCRRIVAGKRGQRRGPAERPRRARRQSETVPSLIQVSVVAEARLRPHQSVRQPQSNGACPPHLE